MDTNYQIPLKYILKDQVNELETKLSEAPTFLSKKEITEQFLLMQLKHSVKAYQFQRIKRSIDIINFRKGLVNIDFLASEACLSRKQYERNFSEYIGTSPRQFLKIVRFQHAIHKKSQDIKSSITDLTYTCGYFDQAHMTNDFNTLSGMTPRQYFMDCEPYSDYFQ
jgi:AraC-like DNA-binding protein